jgi:hypothetical protein
LRRYFNAEVTGSSRHPERDGGKNQRNPWRGELNLSSREAQPRLRAFIHNHFNAGFRIAHSSRGKQHSGLFLGLMKPQDAEPEKREKNQRTGEGFRAAGNRPTASRGYRQTAEDQSLTLF